MFKGINKILIAGVALAAIQSALSMEIYTVKSGDYLYKIAKIHSVKGISNSELTDAIKGINKSEIPGIVDNRIKIGDKLAIPTTKGEVEDGLTLVRNQMIQGSYDQSDNNLPSTPNNSGKARLSDKSMVPTPKETITSAVPSVISQDKIPVLVPGNSNPANSSASETSAVPSVISQDKIPVLVPGNSNPANSSASETYGSNLNSGIDSNSISETASLDENSGSLFSSLFKLIVYIAILAVIFFIAKKFWEGRNSKKEQKLEILGKRKRDHLMSRISPVVSDNDFYKSDNAQQQTSQEEFDFFANNEKSNSEDKLEIDQQESNVEGESKDLDIKSLESDFQNQKNVAIKTEKGVVFGTTSDDVIVGNDYNEVEELDSQDQTEQELQYIDELIEQYLDSEKYLEASITIQDALEKNPNNIELRYRLLEVYAQAGDEIAFEGEVHFIKSKNIVSMFDPLHQKIAKLRDKYFE
ncbi:peptidoglycan-binding protein [Francisella halioticida]|uniref:LysM peptidoglycan-binding domain-containing protein n=1 Tax=Francisella halioticida TaxID=549298 RepID=UPI001AF900E5|nr:LysM peptidoglycan-binding domain-containing protein [Francisella halioticida]BCD91708.1 peptidoglycan-binding protein [Francisella halioticida]